MAHAVFSWVNNVKSSTMTGSSAVVGLDITNVQGDQGSSATAWRTIGTTGYAIADSGNALTTWRALLLARTNLTPAATIRWRVGAAESVIEEPTALAIDFTGPSPALPAGMTFSRAGVATYLTGTTMGLAAANTPRFDRDSSGNSLGLLIEEGRSNLLLDSTTFASGWSAGGNTTSTDIAPPLAGATVKKHTAPVVPADSNSGYYTLTLAAVGTYTISAWFYLPSASNLNTTSGRGLQVIGTGITGGGVASIDGTKRDQWQRVSIQLTTTAANTSINAIVRIDSPVASQAFYSSCWQFEAGDYLTSYIPSSGGVGVRNTDSPNLTFTGTTGANISTMWEYFVTGASTTEGNQGGIVISNSLSEIAYHYNVNQSTNVALGVPHTGGSAAGGAGSVVGIAWVSVASYGPDASRFAFSSTALTAAAAVNYSAPMTTLQFFGTGATRHMKIRLYAKALTQAQCNYLSSAGVSTLIPATYDTGVVPASVQIGFGQSVTLAPSDQVGRYMRCDIADPNNPDGFLSVPLMHGGPIWSPLTNFGFASTLGRDDQVDEATTRAGQEFPILRFMRRRWSITLAGVRGSEVWPDVMEIDRIGRYGSNMLFIPDPASPDIQKEAVYGRYANTADLSWPYQGADRRSFAMTISERL